MKKSLLLAALLLSSAAQAEIYLCNGKAGSLIESDRVIESGIEADFLLDPTQGFKRIGPYQSYDGECHIEADDARTVICSDFDPLAVDIFMMDLDDLRFTRSLNFSGFQFAWTGQCSEI